MITRLYIKLSTSQQRYHCLEGLTKEERSLPKEEVRMKNSAPHNQGTFHQPSLRRRYMGDAPADETQRQSSHCRFMCSSPFGSQLPEANQLVGISAQEQVRSPSPLQSLSSQGERCSSTICSRMGPFRNTEEKCCLYSWPPTGIIIPWAQGMKEFSAILIKKDR